MSQRDRNPPKSPWRPPTRRVFVAMLGAAAAALAVQGRARLLPDREPADEDRPRSTWTGTTRWIGHC
jgi:hypothetical protein